LTKTQVAYGSVNGAAIQPSVYLFRYRQPTINAELLQYGLSIKQDMFNFLNKPNHTGHSGETLTPKGRIYLIRRLVRERFEADPAAQLSMVLAGHSIEALSDIVILSTPDANVVRIAEGLIAGDQRGLEEELSLAITHREFVAAMERLSPYPFPPLPNPLNVWTYADYFLKCQHPDSAPLSHKHIDRVLNETCRFYNHFRMHNRTPL
jgi:hypothetical protein